jgi:pimeloyl-ACP methyl ester carboxylesterase
MPAVSVTAWQESGRIFEHAGHRIFWREENARDAPVLVLIHGFPTSSWDWEAIWNELARHYRLIAPDMLGFGFSDKPKRHRYSIHEQADIHEALLQSLGISEYHVLAHDYGDSVAQELIARDLDSTSKSRLLSVGLLNGGLFPETHRLLRIQKLLLSPLGPLVARMTSRKSLGRSMKRIFGARTQPNSSLLEGFWELISMMDGARALAGLISYIPERVQNRERWVGALRDTALPLLLINGLVDPISGAHMVERFRELVPAARVTELTGIGHYPQIEAPGEVVTAYLQFRASLPAMESPGAP